MVAAVRALRLLAASLACAGAAAWGMRRGAAENVPGGAPQYTRHHLRPELINFPYAGRGDGHHSFHHPFYPGLDYPVSGWRQIGATVVTTADGRDIVRLTNARQGLQGVFYCETHTETNDINGYFDIVISSTSQSREPADGMAFFFSESVPEKGSAMGITDAVRGLGLVVDTFSNSRTRNVPYLYAYVSNGDKKWNAATDGADTELTKGCQLEMNTPTRVFVQLLDSNLHVAVSMNKNHDRWHTCFKYNNVPMPFKKGGFLSFAGETGHFFAFHDVHSAAFIVGDIYDDEDHIRQHKEEMERAQAEAEAARAHEAAEHEYHKEQDRLSRERHEAAGRANAADRSAPSSAQADGRPPDIAKPDHLLASQLDSNIHNIYTEMRSVLSATITGVDPKVTDALHNSLEEMSAMTSHMLTEVDRQTAETADATRALDMLKHSSLDIHSYAERFSAQISKLHADVKELRTNNNRLRADHEGTHSMVRGHSESLRRIILSVNEARPHSFWTASLFIVCQMLVLGGFAVVYKMGSVSRGKMGRMV